MTPAPELLPCPFCGAKMEDFHGDQFTHPLVKTRDDSCILAGLAFSRNHSRWGTDETLRWNRRTPPQPTPDAGEYEWNDRYDAKWEPEADK